jgi:group I intron endonuclease
MIIKLILTKLHIFIEMGYIYKITNTVNNKVYIGQTRKDPDNRWKGHQYSLKNNKGCPLLMRAFRKHGLDKFKFEVIIICFDEARFELEKYYIKKNNSFGDGGYNANEGGEPGGFFKGCQHKPELIERLRQLNIERYKNPENRKALGEKVKEGLSRINLSEKIRDAMNKKREAGVPLFKNRLNDNKLTKEVKNKISAGLIRYYNDTNKEYSGHTDITKNKMKEKAIKRIGRPVNQYTLDGVFVASYPYIKGAAEKTGIGYKTIKSNLLGYSKTAGGFVWKYVPKHDWSIQSFFK